MKRFSWLISKYLVQTILPYFIFSWLLLSVILFVQQASRFSDIFFSANIPRQLVWQLSFALVPNVIAFTCPMAVLLGVIIGLSKMQGDSELIAIRTAGVGNFKITIPVAILGVLLSIFTFLINLYGVPIAAGIVRKVALQTALYKLESPIEPGVFNTEVNGFTIYVKGGDISRGTWRNIFIYNEDKQNNVLRLITSKSGRIDSNADKSELVLENAVVNTINTNESLLSSTKSVSENIGEIRLSIQTKRGEIIEKLSSTDQTPEELGLQDLGRFAAEKTGKEKIEAQILWQRRILLSMTPLIFAILGTSLVLRFNRGGRGFGIFLALISLVIYYLLALLSEQVARTSQLNVYIAGLIPVAVSVIAITWFFVSQRVARRKLVFIFSKKFSFINIAEKLNKSPKKRAFEFNKGILDIDIILNLLKYFLLTFAFLTSIYMVFTAFELWKFAGEINNGFSLLTRYLFYLIPFIYLQLAPSALMIATLTTFVIKSRQNEVVTWTAAGQSVYRLLYPCFALMVLIGFINWGIQERIAPHTNQMQDELRSQIRSRGMMPNKEGKFWVADDQRIYSFSLNEEVNLNEKSNQAVKNLSVYEFSSDGTNLEAIYKSERAVWQKDNILLSGASEKITWENNQGKLTQVVDKRLAVAANPFNELYEKPSHLNSEEITAQIKNSASESEQRNFEVALQKKRTTLFLPLIVTLFTAPFALSLSRKGKVITIGYAIGIWLIFMAVTNTFDQFGLNGLLSPPIAVWSPLLLFTILGTFLLTRIKT